MRSYKTRMIADDRFMNSRFVGRRVLHIFVAVFAVMISLPAALFAQTPPPPSPPPAPALPPSAPADATAGQSAKPPIVVSETVQKARELIDGIDANETDKPSRETLDELERLIADIKAADPAHPWLPYLLARAYEFAGRKGDAIDQLRKFVQTSEGRNEWKAYRVLGDLFVTEFPRLAQGSYEKAAELNPNEPSVLAGLSSCANRAGNLDEEVRLARLAVEADGYKSVRYPHKLARSLMGRQQFDEAEKEATKALAIAEERVQKNPGKRACLQVLIEQYGLLIEIMSGRITASPTVDPAAYIRLTELTGVRADIAYRLAKHDQVAILENAVNRTAPDTPMVLKEKYAARLLEAGRTEDAEEEYEKIVAADPNNKAAIEALAQIRADKSEKK